MNGKLFIIVNRLWNRTNYKNKMEGYYDLLSLMGEKELGGSGALPSNGDLHSVRDSHASDIESTEEVGGNGSLEKITDTENKCVNCGDKTCLNELLCVWCINLPYT